MSIEREAMDQGAAIGPEETIRENIGKIKGELKV